MRKPCDVVYMDQRQGILQQAEKITDPIRKKITLTLVDSIEEVMDALPNS